MVLDVPHISRMHKNLLSLFHPYTILKVSAAWTYPISIPLEDKADGTPEIVSALRTFFSVHKSDCGELQYLSDNDFESLLRLCLTSDVVLIEGTGYTQKSGLGMGNNLDPTLAIIYMNSLDQGILTPE